MSTHAPQKAALHIESINAYGNNALRISIETGSLILDVPTLDALIEELGRLRSEMQPCITREVDRTRSFLVEMDPNWHVQTNALFDGTVLLMRHPGLGWTCFAMPRHSVERLVETLCTQLEQQSMVTEGMPN